MRTRNKSIGLAAAPWRWVFLICLALSAMGTANAVDYFVFGKVMQVTTEAALDNAITDEDLEGEGFPFARVRVFDQGSGSLLGEASAGQNGQYTVTFSLPPATPAPRIEVRAYEEVDGGSTQLAEAREGINLFPKAAGGISTGQLAITKIASDDILEYGAGGFRPYPGVGLVFTRVGKVEIPEISQTPAPAANPAGGLFGLADIASAARAAELGVNQFRRAPFASRLLMFGDFGLPGGATCPGNRIDWYQVNIEPVDHTGSSTGTPFLWQGHMSKRRTQVTVLPSLDVQVTTQKIGPFNGFLDGNPSPVIVTPGASVNKLYWVNRNEVGAVTNTFYSFPDLRVNWVSSLYNGFYKLSLVYYQEVGRTAAGEPILHELPMGQCFASGVPSGDADDVSLHQLYLRVNNQALTARYNGIFLRNRSTGNYYAGEGNADVANKSSAIDFNQEALCDIMELQGIYDVEVGFTARHEGGFLRHYKLDADSNDRTTKVVFAEEAYVDNTTVSNPIWHGTAATGVDVYMVPNPSDSSLPPVNSGTLFDHQCAYDFDLRTTSRLQNGYNWVQWRHPERAYYVMPTTP